MHLSYKYRYFFISILCVCRVVYSTAQISPLANGNIYKISVSQEGMYKITAAYLKANGAQLNGLSPEAVKLYGLPAGMLPQENNAARYDQLQEIATFKSVNGSQFDYLLFFAEGADAYHYDSENKVFSYKKNLYSDQNFYFLKIKPSPEPSLAVQDAPALSGATKISTTYFDYIHHENDFYNLLSTGREWFGERYSLPSEENFNFDITGITTYSPLYLSIDVISSSSSEVSFHFAANGTNLPEILIPPVPSGSAFTYSIKAFEAVRTFQIDATSLVGQANFALSLNYTQESAGISGSGYIDYLGLSFQRSLRLYGNQTVFRKMAADNIPTEYRIANGAAIDMVWDISNPLIPVNYRFSLSADNAVFTSEANGKYVAFNAANLPAPTFEGRVTNQNLYQSATPDLLIISPSEFFSEAERLAAFRRFHDGLQVMVVSPDAIYNEFSSGKQDISAIRDFIRLLYQNDSKLKYLLLFGDASYDYKNRVNNNTNFIPVYEAKTSFDPINSYSSDDFYGFLDDHEGEWQECASCTDHDLDIGIGRLPVTNIRQAADLVDKIIHYSASPSTFGKWRKQLVFIADDEDANVHQRDANFLANFVENNYQNYNINRLFIDAYPQESTPLGERSPIVRKALNQHVERGALIINYSGHGAETGWAEESILSSVQIENWDNYDNMPLFVTATCEFGRYDNPGLRSGAERAILNNKGGAIALLTTTRPVYAFSNRILNKDFYDHVFEPTDGEMPRLGDLMRTTKNATVGSGSNGVINRNFTLLGDPSLKLAYTEDSIAITDVISAHTSTDTIQALSKVTINGVVNKNGITDAKFNGLAEIVVYAQKTTLTTLGNQNTSQLSFQNRSNILYTGRASVEFGQFSFSFVVAKDISYYFGAGKISLYAYDTTRHQDAAGFREDIYVGGSISVPQDNKPPQINAYLQTPHFQQGMQVPADPVLYASIFDENGINTTGIGIGHDLVAVLDGDEDNAFVLNDFFQASLNDYKHGQLAFQFPDLSEGKHLLVVRAWDTHNNFSETELQFFIDSQYLLELGQPFNYPNPFRDQTTFTFTHNREDEELDITIQIYNTQGQLIHTLTDRVVRSSGKVDSIRWDRTNGNGQKIRAGIYLYRLLVKSLKDNVFNRKMGKIFIVD